MKHATDEEQNFLRHKKGIDMSSKISTNNLE